MRSVLIAILLLATSTFSVTAAELILERAHVGGMEYDPIPHGTGTTQVNVYVDDVAGFYGIHLYLRFISKTGADASNFTIAAGDPYFNYYDVVLSEQMAAKTPVERGADAQSVFFSFSSAQAVTSSLPLLLFTITLDYSVDLQASGPYLIDAFREMGRQTEILTTLREGDQKGVPFFVTRGRINVGSSLKVRYVAEDGDDEGEGTAEDPLATIQEAVDRAVDGDVIVLKDGTYTGEGNRDVRVSKTVLICSENGPDDCTISIGATAIVNHRAFYIVPSGVPGGPDRCNSCEIRGLTITGGAAMDARGGGAILVNAASPTIRDCHFVDNSAWDDPPYFPAKGGALSAYVSSPIVLNNTFEGNFSESFGGAVYIVVGRGVFRGNQFTGNSAQDGGGACVEGPGDHLFEHNDFTANLGSGGGIAIGGYSTTPTLVGNSITYNNLSNDFWTWGGGIAVWSGCPTIANNFICNNGAQVGGGIYSEGGSPTVFNNTIAANVSYQTCGGGVYNTSYPPLVIHNCILWYNGSSSLYNCDPAHSCFEGAVENDGNCNISSFPHFVDPASGDFRLKSYSPCIDTGDSDLAIEGDADAEFSPRVLFDEVDIGAHESVSRSGDSDFDTLPDDWEIEHFGDLDESLSGDPDSDGMDNFEEYRDGTPPAMKTTFVYVDARATGFEDGSVDHPFDTIREGVDLSVGVVCVGRKS